MPAKKAKDLKRLYVVTKTSVYQVEAEGENGRPFATKIALHGVSKFPVGYKIDDGDLVAIAAHLQFYIPEGHSMLSPVTSYVRQLEQVNTMWWRTGTSPIVGLFLNKKAALECFDSGDLQANDVRWSDETRKVLKRVGDNHPTITVCHFPGLALIPA